MNARDLYRDVLPDPIKIRLRPLKNRAEVALVWLRTVRRHERLKPSFFIIGAEKAGTTSLFRYLARHPGVVEPLRKEIHYFQASWTKPIDWYLGYFPRAHEVPAGSITGEASPSYLFDPDVAGRVAAAFPDARIIALLREPAARAISHYYHKKNKNAGETRDLIDCLIAEGMEIAPDLTSRLASDLGRSVERVRDNARVLRPPTYIRRGFYADQVAPWLRLFGRERMLILKSEDLFERPRDVYDETLAFLGLRPHDCGPLKAFNTGRYGEVDPLVMRYLAQIFDEPNRRLRAMLGERFSWPPAADA